VTVCIPAWQAESFIDRTLQCARAQVHHSLRIVVSIDRSDDGTAEICGTHAAADDRIEVHVHRERLGWAGNVNFLLDRVDTELGFLYFHDDVIEPTYTEQLVAALRDRPDAASAHCDMATFGGSEKILPGRQYDGSAVERLVAFLTAPNRGSPLRSLIRRSVLAGGLRMPTGSRAGVWANEPFLLRLIAAGPALHVPETLYRRWDQRSGGLTDGWLALGIDEIVEGHRVNAEDGVALIDSLDPSPHERELLLFALYLFTMGRVRIAEATYDAPTITEPERVLPAFEHMTVPSGVDVLPAEIRAWTEAAYDRLLHQTERRRARRR